MKRPKISLIAAVAANGVIGNDNKLLWRYPKDMKRFVKLTKQSGVVIMGRKTFESIGGILENRINIVISHNLSYQANGALVLTLDRALNLARYLAQNREIMVIGGAQIYRAFLPHASKLYITNINMPYHGDAYFPEIDELDWVQTQEEWHGPDAKHPSSFTFDVFERKST